jgi:hypothetical protein
MSEALDRRRLVIVAGLVGACAGAPTTAPQSPAAQAVRIDPPARDEGEPSDATPAGARTVETAPPLSREDCDAFDSASALAIAVVVVSQPDCSSVGHLRVVLEVQRLVRGSGMTHVGTSRALFSQSELRFEVGDTLLVALEPEIQPAETFHCVSLPDRQGSVRHAVKVASISEAEPLLDAIALGRCGLLVP